MACHQVTGWSIENCLSAINILVSTLAIVFSGVLVHCLEKRRGNKQEKERYANLLAGLKAEMKMNKEKIAKQNVGIAKRKIKEPLESENFIFLKKAFAEEILGYANITLNEVQRERILEYWFAVEHANSTIIDYQRDNDVNRLHAIRNFCDADMKFDKDKTRSVPQIIDELSKVL